MHPQTAPWASIKRGPIPRELARMKESSLFAWHGPLARRPHTHRTRPPVQRLDLHEAAVDGSGHARALGSARQVAPASRAATARRLTEDEELFSRMTAVFKDGVLPELNDEWRQVMVRQMGMPAGIAQLLQAKPPSLETLDRAKRCAQAPPSIIEPEPLARMFDAAPGFSRDYFQRAAPDKSDKGGLLQNFKQSGTRPGGDRKTKMQADLDMALRLARLARPSARHVNTKGITKSVSPRKTQETAKLPVETLDALEENHPPELRVVDDEEPPFHWPDLLWATQDRLEWQKNGRRPKPPKNDKEESRFKWNWKKLSEDEQYLHALTLNNAYRGRVKANNLTEDELKEAKMKAKQVRYMWVRRQLKEEEHAVKHNKEQKKMEQKQKREEEERSQAEKLRAEREVERRKMLYQITTEVFQALCTDPETGLPIDPRVIFRRLDTDGGGTVDIDEFRAGLEVCGCTLSDEELDLVWTEIDGADGESDGQVDHETLVRKLKEVNEAQLLQMQPKLAQVLFEESEAARNKLTRQDEKAQQARDQMTPRKMPIPKRKYAFASLEAEDEEKGVSDSYLEDLKFLQTELKARKSTFKSPARLLQRGITFAESKVQM